MTPSNPGSNDDLKGSKNSNNKPKHRKNYRNNQNHYFTNSYAPNGYGPNGYGPNSYTPNQYGPNSYSPNGYGLNSYTPNQYGSNQYPGYFYDRNPYSKNNHMKKKTYTNQHNSNNQNNQNQKTKTKLEEEVIQSMLSGIINEIITEEKTKNSGSNPVIKNITIKKISSQDMPESFNLFNGATLFDPNGWKSLVQTNEPKSDSNTSVVESEEFILDITKEYEELDLKLDSLDALINLGKSYNPETAHKYPLNLKRLNLLVPTLEKLQSTVGMSDVKTSIVNQIVYFMSAFEPNENMIHTVITGPPGTGKTMLGKILGEVYFKLGIIKGKPLTSSMDADSPYPFKIARRSDLIGQYLGQTAIKTQKAIDEAEGGVLFIDEAYSLGSGSADKTDIYSKECIDTLNLNLTEKKKNFVCIIAGYPENLERDFFSVNPGLKRRFPFTYSIQKYTADELGDIFTLMLTSTGSWSYDTTQVVVRFKKFLQTNYEKFPNFGGDMETLLFNVKIAHSLRVIGKHPEKRKKITFEDIENGFKFYELAKTKKQVSTLPEHLQGLYV